ncbi:dockerin type I domain-containing protein [Inconstantimicrobium porci]|uniref:dockerin type I domain-containing protein n=1 Tax=Inconstantimicrobium porci TaxID=2652291 RepID=UPI002409C5B5|nr:dockerin type I domain-containing protein [Inconstantimicrobium porci]MDD6769628.1 cellulase family glycosylhydrolase [Inconstantimicrobium porci]
MNRKKILSLGLSVMLAIPFIRLSGMAKEISNNNMSEQINSISNENSVEKTSFVKTDGNHFVLDGKPFYFEGTNNYYLPYAEDYMVKDVFDKAQLMGIKVMRTWGFNDGKTYDYCGVTLQTKLGEYSEEGFKKFDYVVKEAKEHGIKLVVPFVNNWKEFGGTIQYAKWTGAQYNGEQSEEFYSNDKCKQAYKSYVKFFINRTNSLTGIKYKDDPTIMTWELANEPRCPSDRSCTILTKWADEMSSYIKEIDSNHLVAVGDEGEFNRGGSDYLYNGGCGLDWDKIVALKNIDYGTFHLYPDGWNKTVEWGTQWIIDHINVANKVNKPAVLEEYGVRSDKEKAYRTWGDTILQYKGAGSMFWLLTGVTWGGTSQYPDYDGFNVNYSDKIASVLKEYAEKMSAQNIAENKVGDVNEDGIVDTNDFIRLKNFIKYNKKNVKINEKNADINKDGKVNISDLALLKALL